MNKPQYIIVAGINGAGKSSLYEVQPQLFKETKRLNADEILREMGGDWHKNSDNLKAMREEIKQLHAAIEKKESIHVETTLAGVGKAQEKLIDKAHTNGFEVTLLYVTLDSAERAIERVNQRVEKGGHGISADLIKKRYRQSHENLPRIAFKSDNVLIYDNSSKFKRLYIREGATVREDKLQQAPWIKSSLSCSNQIQNELKNYAKKNLEIKQNLKQKNPKKDRPDL